MNTVESRPAKNVEQQSRGFDALEALLKWGSIAYGLGFLTVAINTARLGIPTLELIEPLQVAVGAPVTLILWLVILAFRFFRRSVKQLPEEIQRVQQQYEGLKALVDQGRIKEATKDLLEFVVRDSFTISLPFLNFGWMGRVLSFAFSRFSADLTDHIWATAGERNKLLSDQEKLKRDQEQFRRLLIQVTKFATLAQRLRSVVSFGANVITVAALILVLLFVYICVLYPEMPQRWGGGAPTQVAMVLSKDDIPAADPEINTLFPATERLEPAKDSLLTKTIQLLYTTNEAYYVRLDSGRVARISAHAVNVIIFEKPR